MKGLLRFSSDSKSFFSTLLRSCAAAFIEKYEIREVFSTTFPHVACAS